MLLNIIDGRKYKYRWREINAVIEDTSHDNSCENSDQIDASADKDYIMYEDRKDISLHEAILWAESSKGHVTLFLYDKGDGIE